MNMFENRYYKISKFLLILIGQWPYDRSWTKLCKQIFVYLYMSSYICVQVSNTKIFHTIICCYQIIGFSQIFKFWTEELTLELMTIVATPLLVNVICLTKYLFYTLKGHVLFKLLEHLRHDWSVLSNANETKVLKMQAAKGGALVLLYIGFIYIGILLYTLLQFVPYFLDVIAPLNESRHHVLPYAGEYFVDQQKYFVPIALHLLGTITIGLTVSTAVDSILIFLTFHICAKFNILGDRLEDFMDENGDKKQRNGEARNDFLMNKLVRCVRLHQQNIELKFDCVAANIAFYYIFALIFHPFIREASYFLNIFTDQAISMQFLTYTSIHKPQDILRLNLVQVFISVEIEEMILSAVHMVGYLLLTFLNIFPLQKLLDHSSEIFYRTYYSRWYDAPLKIQKLVLIVMNRSFQPCGFRIADYLDVTLENFSFFLQTCCSYFMVLYSLQK
ncbi:hypothetical protein ANTQUA_LOCUS9983, partial [Anthophora quadrimaculata]